MPQVPFPPRQDKPDAEEAERDALRAQNQKKAAAEQRTAIGNRTAKNVQARAIAIDGEIRKLLGSHPDQKRSPASDRIGSLADRRKEIEAEIHSRMQGGIFSEGTGSGASAGKHVYDVADVGSGFPGEDEGGYDQPAAGFGRPSYLFEWQASPDPAESRDVGPQVGSTRAMQLIPGLERMVAQARINQAAGPLAGRRPVNQQVGPMAGTSMVNTPISPRVWGPIQ